LSLRSSRNISRKEALVLSVLTILGFAGWLYLGSFGGILNLAYRTGEVVIRADRLMLAESFLLLGVSFCLALLALYSAVTLASQLRKRRGEKF